MKEIFGFDGSFVRFMTKVYDLMVLGFLWILCSIPIITIGASTTALYYAIVKSVKNNNGYPIREFFHGFRQNLKAGTLLWLIVLAVVIILQVNIWFLSSVTDGNFWLFFICLYFAATIYMIAAALYMFPALSRFDMGIGWILKLSLYMVVRYFGTTLALAAALFCIGAFVYRFPILFIFVPAPTLLLMAEFLERVLKNHEPKQTESEAETGDDAVAEE